MMIRVFLTILLFAFAFPTHAKPLEVLDVFGLEYAESPAISPDGDQVVYVRRHMDTQSDRSLGQLWLIDLESGRQQPLTDGDGSYSSPAWAPDGERIAFVGHDGDGDRQLQVLWLKSGRQVKITRGPHAPSNPSWSPDSSRIAFSRFVPDMPPQLVKPLKAPDGANWAPPPTVVDRPVFRVDGMGMLPHGQTQRFIVAAAGGPTRQITDGPWPNDGAAAWTQDGTALIFAATRRDDWQLEGRDTDLYRFDLESGEVTQLTERYGPDASPALSPNGRQLAWLGFDDQRMSYTNTEVWMMPVDGGDPRSLTADLDRNVDAFAWDRRGNALFISYSDEGTGVIDRLTLDGQRERIASDLGGTTLGRPYASGDFGAGRGEVVFTRTSPEHPADLVRVDARGRESRLTTLNSQLLGHRDLARVEEITWPSSHDGLEIEGWVAYPPAYDPEQRYPLILEIHGGPFADYGPRFSMEVQLMAAAGYVVLYANPRGSTSYGADFANEIHHAYPGNDYHDLISGVDTLIERGIADPERLYVTGGSGGGVLTAWIVGTTDRFRAAVVAKPVINWTSFVLTGDFTPFFHKYWFPALPWEAPDHYWQRSPLSRVGNVTTPTMVLTGEADWRTPMWESEQFYQALKLRGIDTVLVRIPEAPHGIAARPSQLVTKVRHILAWFEKFGE